MTSWIFIGVETGVEDTLVYGAATEVVFEEAGLMASYLGAGLMASFLGAGLIASYLGAYFAG